MKYLIFGGNGLVGSNLRKILQQKGETVFATSIDPEAFGNAILCNILNISELKEVFNITKPDVVINATNLAGGVDFCEKNPELSEKFHFDANVNIGKLCLQYKSIYVIISTDYVFDGSNPPYLEKDETHPLNFYGKHKLMAEKWLISNMPDSLIIRTTNVFGWDPFTKTPNFLMGLYFRLIENQQVKVPSFLWGNPTHAADLSNAIIELCENHEPGTEIFNVVGSSFINRYEWSIKFCEIMNLETSLIIKSEDIPYNMVPRPLKSNLSISKFKSLYKTPLHNVDDGLIMLLEEKKQK